MQARLLMRVASQTLSMLFGSTGIFCVWASFHNPHAAVHAIFCLAAATALTLVRP